MNLMQPLYILVTALFAALIMVPFLRRWALESGELDEPDGGRKVHEQATPRIGGIAVFMAFLFALLVHADLASGLRGVLAGGLVVFITGMVDDLYGISARRKFLGQIGGCLVAMAVGGIYLDDLGNLLGFGAIHLPFWLAVPFTVFAVVGVSNALNLIDGLDGLAGGVSVIAFAGFSVLAWYDGNQAAMRLSAAGLGAILGFLKFNFYPARIFMGDAGSLSIGFLLGFVAIQLTQTAGSGVQPLIPVLILGLPILDTLWVMTRRVLRRTSPFAPDRTHLHHKFLNLGLEHRFTVILIYGLSLFWAIFSLVFRQVPEYLLLWSYLAASALLYLGVKHVLRHPQRFSFLSRDSAKGLRTSAPYRKLAARINRAVPVLGVLVVAYLAMLAWGTRTAGQEGWQVNGLLCMTGVGLLVFTRNARNQFLLAMTYIAGLVITLTVEVSGMSPWFGGISTDRVVDGLFLAMGGIVLAKMVFRQEGDFFISTADILFFGLSILASIALAGLDLPYGPWVLVRAGILYLAVKTLVADSRRTANIAVGSVLTVLLLLAMRGYLG